MADQPAAVLTGASGEIGQAIAKRLTSDGHRVLGLFHSGEREIRSLQSEIGSDQLEPVQVDLADLGRVEEVARQLASEHDVTVLVHCAGELPRDSWDQTSTASFLHAFQVNCASAFVLARELTPSMLRAGGGAIVNVASVHALEGSQRRSAYATSKAALVGLTKALAVELAPSIRVNAVIPGVFETSMNSALLEDAALLAETERHIPLRRLGSAEECAQIVGFLASSAAGYVTGATFAVDGGVLARTPLPGGDPPT